MNVDASELAVAATNMKVAEGALEEDFPMIAPLYIRLRAYINESMGEIISNTITTHTANNKSCFECSSASFNLFAPSSLPTIIEIAAAWAAKII